MVQRRIFSVLVVAFITVACGVGALVIRAFRPDWHVMPGPLGRVARPLAAGKAEKLRCRNTEIMQRGAEWPAFDSRSSDQPTLRASGYQTRAFSGLRTEEEQTWAKRNGLTETLEFMHHLNAVFPPKLYATHPEYFPLNGGKRIKPPQNAQFWQPDLGREDVARYAADQAKRYFDQHPSAESFSLGVDDGLNFGESEETLALLWKRPALGKAEKLKSRDADINRTERQSGHETADHDSEADRRASDPRNLRTSKIRYFRGRPDFSRVVFTFMNRAAADLARYYPDKYLGCLAYYWCENVPPFSVDPHVVPFLTADRSQNYDPAFRREELALQEAWVVALGAGNAEKPKSRDAEMEKQQARALDSEFSISAFQAASFSTHGAPIQPRLGLYDYLDGYGFLVPRVPIHAFAEHIRHAYDAGFTDYFGESNWNWGVEGPMPWVISQLLRYPEQDVDRLLDLYYATYFQRAAGPMRQFFDRCEQQWMNQSGPSYWLKHYRNTSQAALFPTPVCRDLRALLTEAAAQANCDIVRQRVSFVSDAFGLTERFVAFCEARNELTACVLRHDVAGSEGERLLASYLEKRRRFFRYGHELEQRCPLAFYPINYQDWVRDDPTFAAREELAAFRGSEDRPTSRSEALKLRTSDPQSAGAAGREVLHNGTLAGPLIAGRRIAGLTYGIDLPSPWQSRVEPTQFGVAKLGGESEGQTIGGAVTNSRVLRLSSQVSAIAFSWAPATPGKTYAASVWTRAQVSSSDIVELVLGWLDASEKQIGKPIGIRLPDGNWPNWVQLVQGAKAPEGAAWVGIQLLVEHQVGDDWAEARDFSLREQ